MFTEIIIVCLSLAVVLLTAFLALILRSKNRRYKKLKNKFATYLETLDEENERLRKKSP